MGQGRWGLSTPPELRWKPQEEAVRQQEQDTERPERFASRAVRHNLLHQLPSPTQTHTHTHTHRHPTTVNKEIPPADPHSRTLPKLSALSNFLERSGEIRSSESVHWRAHQEATSLDISQMVGESVTRLTIRMCDMSSREPGTTTCLNHVDHATRSAIAVERTISAQVRRRLQNTLQEEAMRTHSHAAPAKAMLQARPPLTAGSDSAKLPRMAFNIALSIQTLVCVVTRWEPNLRMAARGPIPAMIEQCRTTELRTPSVHGAYYNRIVPERKARTQATTTDTLIARLHAGGERDLARSS